MKTMLTASLLLLGACASPLPRQETLSERDLRPYSQEGSGTIGGRVWTEHAEYWGSERVDANRARVELVPATPYTREWFERTIGRGEKLEPEDPRLESYRRQATTDGRGRFRFTGLPPGEYYVTSRFSYEVPDPFDSQGRMETFHVLASRRVSLADGERVDDLEVTP